MKKFLIFAVLVVLASLLLTLYQRTFTSYNTNNQEKNNQPTDTKNIYMKISSSAFESNQKLPKKYTCDGENINPPLQFIDVSKEAKSLVLIVDDPDAPVGTFVHWVLFNIPPTVQDILENSVPSGSIQGKNSAGLGNFIGACPPSGTHRYFFKLYALDTVLNLSSSITKQDIEKAMENHVLNKTELIGLYSRS